MTTNFRVKIGKIGLPYSSTFIAMAFQNRVEYRHSDFKRFNCDDLAARGFTVMLRAGYTLGSATHFSVKCGLMCHARVT